MLGDALLAVTLAAAGVAMSAGPWAWHSTARRMDVAGGALALAAALPLVLRRAWPLATLLVTSAATAAYLIAGYPYGFILVSVAVAVYTIAVRLPMRQAAIGSMVALVLLLVHTLAGPSGRGDEGFSGLLAGSAWVVVPFAVGLAVRFGRESAVRSRDELVSRLAYEERLRIALEVHDVVGHGLAAINMQAEIALHVLPKRPEQAEHALAAISRTSKVALDELRVTLAVVRQDGDASPRTPGAGLADLDDLVARMSGAGIGVGVTVGGTPGTCRRQRTWRRTGS